MKDVTIKLPNLGSEFMYTGEYREPKEGEHYFTSKGKLILCTSDFGSYKSIIVHKTRWRAVKGGTYYRVNVGTSANTMESLEKFHELSTSCYKSGNYFKTEEEAQSLCDKINKLLLAAHKHSLI